MIEEAPVANAVDFGAILHANLERAFSEKDPVRRMAAIRDIYSDDALLYKPDRSVRGHEAIARTVAGLIDSLPADFTFSAIRPGLRHHDPGRIQTIHVFLDQPVNASD